MILSLASWVMLILARIPLLWLAWENPVACTTTDSSGYLQLASNLVHHAAYSESPMPPWIPATFRVPVYPLFVSLFVALFKDPIPWIAAAQIVLSLVTVVLLERWLRTYAAPPQSGWIATGIGLDIMSLIHTPLVLTETFFTFTLVAALWGNVKAQKESSSGQIFASGGLWSLAVMTRPIAFYFPILLSFMWLKNKKHLALFLLGAYLLPGLWMARNWKITGHAVYSTQGGYELLRCPGAAVESLRTGKPWSIVWPKLLETLNQKYPDTGLYAYERSQVASQMAKDIILANPLLLVRHCVFGVIKTLGASSFILPIHWWAPSFTQDVSLQTRPRLSENLELFRHFPVLIPIQLAYSIYLLFFYIYWMKGLVTLWISGRKGEAWVLFTGVAYFIALASVEGQGRYRIPIMPFLAGAAAAGLKPRQGT